MIYLNLFFIFVSFFLFSCSNDNLEESQSNNGKIQCSSSADCPFPMECDFSSGFCINPQNDSLPLPDNTTNDNSEKSDTDTPNGAITKECTPGKVQKCPYQGAPTTENVGPCKAGSRTCNQNGTWGICKGEVLPKLDDCSNAIDDDCDGKIDNGTDLDGDGYTSCNGDCCDNTQQCPNPDKVHPGAKEIPNGIDDNCNGKIDEGVYDCDTSIANKSKTPMDLAKAMGLCKQTTENSGEWGVISAEILKANGNKNPSDDAYAVLSSLGDNIKPKQGKRFTVLTTGKAENPFPSSDNDQLTSSNVPEDWYSANGNKFPSAPACGSIDAVGNPTYDNVMLKLKIRVPPLAKSFKFKIYFLSKEFPVFVCSKFNDFFLALLDSKYTSTNPNLQNPKDKNLAMDAKGNPVGVNLAKSGLFTVCNNPKYPSCAGDSDLDSTGGFKGHGATGWLTTRGNVVPGEIITLRLVIWDTGDHIYDSMVLIDNFEWQFTEYKPGTGNEK